MYSKLLTFVLVGIFLSPLAGSAQQKEQLIPGEFALNAGGAGIHAPDAVGLNSSDVGSPAAGGGAPAPADTTSSTDDQWHIGFLPYLWFPGVHGTTGVRGVDVSFHASPGDLLSHFDIGLMGTMEARKNHVVLPVDLVWTAISDDKGLPENDIGVDSISARAEIFILTPKAGYEIVDAPKVKVDSLVGLRYWHLGERLHFNPNIYQDLTPSENWVDAVAGARIQMLLSQKASITIAGDAGGGQANSDYNVAGLLGLKVKKNLALQAGWRYLDVHYRNQSDRFLYDVAESGAVFGAVFYLK
jgi:hypothetical protein